MAFIEDDGAGDLLDGTEDDLDNGTLDTEDNLDDEGADDIIDDEGGEAPRKYKVKVDGEELEVDEDELLNGYSRHADYTRKTQALKARETQLAEADALAAALRNNPQATIALLQNHFGLDVQGGDAEDLDPLEAKVQEMERMLQAQQAKAQQDATLAEANAALSKHQLADTPVEELFRFAMDRKIMDLDTAAELYALKVGKEKAAEATTNKTKAKRSAAVVEGGKPRSNAARSTKTEATDVKSAMRAAMAELGFSFDS